MRESTDWRFSTLNTNAGSSHWGSSSWKQAVAKYQSPDLRRSLWQLANTFIPYLLLWYLMVRSLAVSYWLTLGLSVLAAGFLLRIFIFFHDCGHGSFFRSSKANDTLGIITGLLTFTPYYYWRHTHAVHHATVSDLDRRGIGDVWTMTVEEYSTAPRWRRIAYRIFRFPPVTFLIGPVFVFLLVQRFPLAALNKRERNSVWWTNLALLGIAALMSALIGLQAYVLIQLPIMVFAGMAGVWMFYVQHQFEGTYWERHERWDFVSASLVGSSYYKLPRVFQWISGNIGFHHIHHLSPRIANYNLARCYAENPVFQQVAPLTFVTSLRALGLHLWDEEKQVMVGFREAAKGNLKLAGMSNGGRQAVVSE
jgi:acyl-lipid omega-6 desaturase (Delta-12 desaturase)